MVIHVLNLALRYLKLSHHLFDKLDSVLKSSVGSYLDEHGNLVELGLAGYVGEVILAIRVFLGIKCKVKCDRSALDVKLSALDSALIVGLTAPAASSLDTLVGEKYVLNYGVVILNVCLSLNQA